jgi:ADP-ribose pyrophosphatase YjhB (NUDIX family)
MPKIKVRVQAAIVDSDRALLLGRHHKNDKDYWVLPGGGGELYERLEDALARELDEELGLSKTTVEDMLFADEYIDKDAQRHVVLICFSVKVPDEDLKEVKVKADGEAIVEARLFTAEEIVKSPDTFYPSKAILHRIIENS